MNKVSAIATLFVGTLACFSLGTAAYALPSPTPDPVNIDAYWSDDLPNAQELSDNFQNQDFIRGYQEGQAAVSDRNALSLEGGTYLFSAQGDGCTFSPDAWGSANFLPACNRHDFCYSSDNTQDRLTCDKLFYVDLQNICWAAYNSQPAQHTACKGVAWSYYQAVRAFGGSHYEGRGKNN